MGGLGGGGRGAGNGEGMAVTTLRQMTHTEIGDSFKYEFLGASL